MTKLQNPYAHRSAIPALHQLNRHLYTEQTANAKPVASPIKKCFHALKSMRYEY